MKVKKRKMRKYDYLQAIYCLSCIFISSFLLEYMLNYSVFLVIFYRCSEVCSLSILFCFIHSMLVLKLSMINLEVGVKGSMFVAYLTTGSEFVLTIARSRLIGLDNVGINRPHTQA